MGSSRTSQLGLVDEVTPGLVVTPSLFLPVTGAAMTAEDAQTESEAIIAGRYTIADWQSNGGNVSVTGNIETELYNKGVGFLLKHATGADAVNTTGAGPYVHTGTMGTKDGNTFTVQEGIEDDAGVVQPLTSSGCKITELDIAWDTGEIVNVTADVVAMRQEYGSVTLTGGETTDTSTALVVASGGVESMVGATITATGVPTGTWVVAVNSATSITMSAAATATATGLSVVIGKALATASYPSALKPYKALHTSVTVAGSAVESYGGNVNIATTVEPRFPDGSRWSTEPKETGELRVVTGQFEIEHNAAIYRRYQTGEKMALVTTFSNGADSLVLTSSGRITATPTPVIGGRSRNMMSVGWKGMGSTDNNTLTWVLTNGEATI